MRMHPCMRTHATVQKLLCHGSYLKLILSKACASIMQAVVCRSLLQPLLLSRPNPSPDAVLPRNPSKSTLAHDEVAAAVSHKHHSIDSLVQASSSLSMGCTRAWPRSSLFTKIYIRHFLRECVMTGVATWVLSCRFLYFCGSEGGGCVRMYTHTNCFGT